ncbi:MAG: MEKHLA domain-containing protein [Pseudomonadota bacterium]
MNLQSDIRPVPTRENGYLNGHAQLLVDSFRRWTGRTLIDCAPAELGRELFYAPFVIASHDTQSAPVFNYANLAALQLWETNWEMFTSKRSSDSAEADAQVEREQFMARVAAQGCVSGYSGVRISMQGRRFRIDNATVWNVLDAAGGYHGQAVWFDAWQYIE